MIPTKVLEAHGAVIKSYGKASIIFSEETPAKFYFQIKSGKVKAFNLTEDGKEFAQGFFESGDSFGEPPLIGEFNYPATTVAIENCELYVLPKATFFELLKTHPNLHLKITQVISKRMMYKATIMKEISIYPPEHRIFTLLNYLKQTSESQSPYEVTLTRQQISELTGLRVETVIKAIKKLESAQKLSIKDRKVYL